jgi:NAD(P)-dependent dehydrogenase (short-subunit alcohol dehydrogenase family)
VTVTSSQTLQAAAKPLAGTTALVTGAAKRIGRAVALALAEAGADIAITYRQSRAEAEEALATFEAVGVRASAHACDLDDPSAITATVKSVVRAHGRLDLLVNNAGTFASAPLEDISAADWDNMFAANTRGPFLMAQAAFPHLKAAQGRIVNIGSLGGIEPWATHAHYCTSKAALHMLSKTMAKAWAPEISVNCVAPGMIVQGEVGAAYQHFADRTPMKRNGTSADVAAAVLFFATGPHFITGQLLTVDGGLGL